MRHLLTFMVLLTALHMIACDPLKEVKRFSLQSIPDAVVPAKEANVSFLLDSGKGGGTAGQSRGAYIKLLNHATGQEQLVVGSESERGIADGVGAAARFMTLSAGVVLRNGSLVVLDHQVCMIARIDNPLTNQASKTTIGCGSCTTQTQFCPNQMKLKIGAPMDIVLRGCRIFVLDKGTRSLVELQLDSGCSDDEHDERHRTPQPPPRKHDQPTSAPSHHDDSHDDSHGGSHSTQPPPHHGWSWSNVGEVAVGTTAGVTGVGALVLIAAFLRYHGHYIRPACQQIQDRVYSVFNRPALGERYVRLLESSRHAGTWDAEGDDAHNANASYQLLPDNAAPSSVQPGLGTV